MSDAAEPQSPIIYPSLPLSRRRPALGLTVRFKPGNIVLSTDLFKHLQLQEYKRVAFVEAEGVWYIMRVDSQAMGFPCSVRSRKDQVSSVIIHHKPLCEHLRHYWEHGPQEEIRFHVSRHPIPVSGLDTIDYPHPTYRLIAN